MDESARRRSLMALDRFAALDEPGHNCKQEARRQPAHEHTGDTFYGPEMIPTVEKSALRLRRRSSRLARVPLQHSPMSFRMRDSDRSRYPCGCGVLHSTVTDFARLRGWSISVPRASATR